MASRFQHFQRLQQLLMHHHQWENRCVPQYNNGHDISPTKIKVHHFEIKATKNLAIYRYFNFLA
jgi:hypothetical protein